MSAAEAPPSNLTTERVASAMVLWAALSWIPLAAVLLGVVPRVWLPLLDRDAGLGVLLLWVLALPLAAMTSCTFVGYLAWDVRRRAALARDLKRDTVPRAKAFEEGGVTTLAGVIEGEPTTSPFADLPCVAWVQRRPGEKGVEAPSNVSHAAPFTLALDDGTRIEAEGGAWRVADPFAPWVLLGEARVESGDRVRVRARVSVSLEASEGDYRASAMRQTLVAEGGLIAPEPTGAPRSAATRAEWVWPALAYVTVFIHAIVRLTQPAPLHFNVAVGAPCDARHSCASGSYCDVGEHRRRICVRDCARDADCGDERRCNEYAGRCDVAYENYGRTGTRTQGQDCTAHRCAPDFRCIQNLTRDDPASGVYNGPASYCVRVCRRDDQCPAGTVCVAPSRGATTESWCDRPENLMPIFRVMRELERDGSVPR